MLRKFRGRKHLISAQRVRIVPQKIHPASQNDDSACRQREKQGAKLRKAAEKLLLAHLKKHALDNISNGQEPRAGAAAAAAEQLTAASAAVEQV